MSFKKKQQMHTKNFNPVVSQDIVLYLFFLLLYKALRKPNHGTDMTLTVFFNSNVQMLSALFTGFETCYNSQTKHFFSMSLITAKEKTHELRLCPPSYDDKLHTILSSQSFPHF